jgi:TonB dependent receptor-like, beta-barrel/Carboxypeptidase regulatory-like domain
VLVKVQATGQQALTDGDGRFEIADVPPGPQTVMISVVGYGLVKRDVVVVAGEAAEVTIPVAEGASGYVEEVSVGAPIFRQAEAGVASQSVLGSRDLLALRGVIADDPFRAVQVLPGVATGDDFRAEFAVRGLGPEHVGVALDGIDSPLLFHTVRGIEDTGSLALINSDILDSATLLSGAYPQRVGAHLGARLDFTTRDGARDRVTARALLSGTAATTVWEGPLGNATRGAWIVAARRSYIDWLLRKIDPEIAGAFGFTDVQAKVTLDLSPRQTLQASVIGGRSLLSEADETPGLNSLDKGRNRTAIGNVRWRFTPSPTFLITQQAYIVDGRYKNTIPDGRVREEGLDRDITWRASIESSLGAHHTFELGGQGQWLRAERTARSFSARGAFVSVDGRASYNAGAAWLHYRWLPTGNVLISPGARVDRFGLVGKTTVSPWVLAELEIKPGTRLRIGAGRQHQPPTFDQTLRPAPGVVLTALPPPVRPEQSTGLDVGLDRRVTDAWRVTMTGYVRDERHRLRFENSEFRAAGNVIVRPGIGIWANTLTGDARGIEATVERRVVNGISGWISYGYGHASLDDAATGESFPSDFDQTHMVNAYAIYRTSNKLGLSARFRYGSNFPIPGYYVQVGDSYFVGAERNAVRLPAYARLDLRADRVFTYRRSRLTLFVEVLNALKRSNFAMSEGSLNLMTGQWFELTEKGFPLLPSAGILIEF